MFGIEDYSKPIIDFANFNSGDFATALSFGGVMLLIGMLTIFSVLCIIWAAMVLFKVVFHDIPQKKVNHEVEEAVVVAPAITVANNDDAEIIAVISAAIAAAESDGTDVKFKVVSFKRK